MTALLDRIATSLEGERDPIRRACLLAEKAAYLGRVGSFGEAREIVEQLRIQFGDGRSGHVTVRIMLAEAAVLKYSELSPEALDKAKRAQVLSEWMRDRELIALSAAWRAYLEFDDSRFDQMFSALKLCEQHLSPEMHSAAARYGAVLCSCFALTGNHEQAKRWFLHSRESALAYGDRASLESLIHNKAVFTLSWLRSGQCLEPIDPSALSLARAELMSAKNYQDLIQIRSFTHFVKLWQARALILGREFSMGMSELVECGRLGPYSPSYFSSALLSTELAYCSFSLGRIGDALMHYEATDQDEFASLDVDERLVVGSYLLQMSEADSRFGDPIQRRDDFGRCKSEYLDLLTKLRSELTAFEMPSK